MQSQLGEQPDSEEVNALFESLTTTSGANPLLRFGTNWVAFKPLEFSEETVPDALLELVGAGAAGQMRISLNGEPAIVTGVELPGRDAAYYEARFIGDVGDTVRSLGLILLGVGTANHAARRRPRPRGHLDAHSPHSWM